MGNILYAEIDSASPEDRKNLLRAAATTLGIEQTSPRFHRAFYEVMEMGRPSGEALADAVRLEDRARQEWVNCSLQPWCERHGLTLQQGLSVLFDDGPFNAADPSKDLVTRESVFAWSGQQNTFASRLMRDMKASNAVSPSSQPSTTLKLSGVQRWDVMEGSERAQDGEPAYEIRVVAHPASGQVNIDILPPQCFAAMDEMARGEVEDGDPRLQLPGLSLGIEINGGLPCAHIHAGPMGELAQSVFGMEGGKVAVREVDDPGMKDALVKVPDSFSPDLAEVRAVFARASAEGASDDEDCASPGTELQPQG